MHFVIFNNPDVENKPNSSLQLKKWTIHALDKFLMLLLYYPFYKSLISSLKSSSS